MDDTASDEVRDRQPPADPRDRTIRLLAWAGVVGVGWYVASWAVAGVWRDGYDPVSQSISELFAIGAPAGPARLLVIALVATGLLLVPFAWALDAGLPGHGTAGPIALAVSGVATAMVVAFPCTAGCPGIGASTTDTMHTLVAGGGYAALVGAPLLFAWRLRRTDPGFARLSLVLGAVAGVGFVARALGAGTDITGLLQRIFNTTADLWLVLAAVAVLRGRRSRPSENGPGTAAGLSG